LLVEREVAGGLEAADRRESSVGVGILARPVSGDDTNVIPRPLRSVLPQQGFGQVQACCSLLATSDRLAIVLRVVLYWHHIGSATGLSRKSQWQGIETACAGRPRQLGQRGSLEMKSTRSTLIGSAVAIALFAQNDPARAQEQLGRSSSRHPSFEREVAGRQAPG
jgi:hypothetical protein